MDLDGLTERNIHISQYVKLALKSLKALAVDKTRIQFEETRRR